MARSEGLVLFVMLPCVKSLRMAAVVAPRPTCRGFVPPFSAVGREPTLNVRASCVANSTVEALKPFVPALAMLLPRTSIVVSFRINPFNDVLRADVRPIGTPQGQGASKRAGLARRIQIVGTRCRRRPQSGRRHSLLIGR